MVPTFFVVFYRYRDRHVNMSHFLRGRLHRPSPVKSRNCFHRNRQGETVMSGILLVSEQTLVRASIKRVLRDITDTEVVAETASGQDGIEKLRVCKADMVIMDIGAEEFGVFDLVRRMQMIDSNIKIIIITAIPDAAMSSRVLKMGASACLSKQCSANELDAAIKSLNAGQRYISSKVAEQMLQAREPHQAESPFLNLSNRELQIMYMFTRAMSVGEISERLYLSPKTISTYRYRIFAKLGVRGDVELTHLAMRYGMIEGEYLPMTEYRKAG